MFLAREEKRDPIEAVVKGLGGKLLFRGRITGVERKTVGGFSTGIVTMEGPSNITTTPPASSTSSTSDGGVVFKGQFQVHFQNENVVAYYDGSPIAYMPDLISILETQTGNTIATETVVCPLTLFFFSFVDLFHSVNLTLFPLC